MDLMASSSDNSASSVSDASGDSGHATQNLDNPKSAEKPSNPFLGTKHKVKIDSQELEVPYEQLITDYQLGKVSRKKFEEAASMKRDIDSFMENLSKGDLKLLKDIIPPEQLRAFAEQELREFVEDSELSDDERDRRNTKKENEQLRKDLENERREKLEVYNARIEQQAAEELDIEIAQAIKDLKAEQGLDPDHPVEAWFVAEVARMMESYYESLEDDDESYDSRLPAKEATSKAWKGVESTVVNYLNTIPTDKVIALLPRQLRDAIRKADLGEVVTKLHDKTKNASDTMPSRSDKPREDMFNRLDKQFSKRR